MIGIEVEAGTKDEDIIAGTKWFLGVVESMMKMRSDYPEDLPMDTLLEDLKLTLHPVIQEDGARYPYFGVATSGYSTGFTEYLYWKDGEVRTSEDDGEFYGI